MPGEQGGQLVGSVAGVHGVRHEGDHLLVPELGDLRHLAGVARPVAEQDQPVDPCAYEHQVGPGQFLVVEVGDRTDGDRGSGRCDGSTYQLGRPSGVAGAALVDDDHVHGHSVPAGGGGPTLAAVPTYDYRCGECGSVFDMRRPMAESSDPATCPNGHDGARRMLSVFAGVGASGSDRAAGPVSTGGCGGACACHPG